MRRTFLDSAESDILSKILDRDNLNRVYKSVKTNKGATEGGGNFYVMKKLNYRFYNLNLAKVTANFILKVLIEANIEKVEKILQENMVQMNMGWNKVDR